MLKAFTYRTMIVFQGMITSRVVPEPKIIDDFVVRTVLELEQSIEDAGDNTSSAEEDDATSNSIGVVIHKDGTPSDSFFPYDVRLLRCHPLWVSVDRTTTTNIDQLFCLSKRRVRVFCAVCRSPFDGRLSNLINQTTRCTIHNKELRTAFRPRYSGNLPPVLTSAVRGACLRGIANDDQQLLDLVSFLASQHNCSLQSREIINEVSRYTTVQLKDNTFWAAQRQKRFKNSAGESIPKRARNERLSSAGPVILRYPTGWAFWAPVLRQIRPDPLRLYEIWAAYIQPLLQLPSALDTGWVQRTGYNVPRAHCLLNGLADCLSLYYLVDAPFYGQRQDSRMKMAALLISDIRSQSCVSIDAFLGRLRINARRCSQIVD